MQRRPSKVPHHRAGGPGGSGPGRGRARVCPGDRVWWAPSPRPPRAVSHSHSHQQALGTECPRSGEGGRQGDSGGLWRSGHGPAREGVGRTFWNIHFTFSFHPCDFRLCTCVEFRKHVGARAPHPLPNGQTRAGQRAQRQRRGSPCTPHPELLSRGCTAAPSSSCLRLHTLEAKGGPSARTGVSTGRPEGPGGGAAVGSQRALKRGTRWRLGRESVHRGGAASPPRPGRARPVGMAGTGGQAPLGGRDSATPQTPSPRGAHSGPQVPVCRERSVSKPH